MRPGGPPPKVAWEWMFYLVVVAGNYTDPETRPIYIQVSGAEAENLLGLQACDLHCSSAAQTLARLHNTLFLLWGDLEECKREYLAANPEVIPDSEWSCMAAGIVPSNRAFRACVEEYGIRLAPHEDSMNVDVEDDLNEGMGWVRAWRLFGTRINNEG